MLYSCSPTGSTNCDGDCKDARSTMGARTKTRVLVLVSGNSVVARAVISFVPDHIVQGRYEYWPMNRWKEMCSTKLSVVLPQACVSLRRKSGCASCETHQSSRLRSNVPCLIVAYYVSWY